MMPRLAIGSVTRIGWRNLWRNRRRTILALSAIGLAQALVLIYDGILGAYGDWMVATVTGPMLGHVQAHAPGWRKDRAMDKTIPNAAGVLAAVRGERDVAAASGRVYAPALAAAGAEGFAVVVVGIAPDVESRPMGLLSSTGVTPGGRQDPDRAGYWPRARVSKSATRSRSSAKASTARWRTTSTPSPPW